MNTTSRTHKPTTDSKTSGPRIMPEQWQPKTSLAQDLERRIKQLNNDTEAGEAIKKRFARRGLKLV